MKTLFPGKVQAKGADISKAKGIEGCSYTEYRDEVLARLLPGQPRPPPSASDVLTNALETCNRNMAYVRQQSFTRAPMYKPSLNKMQYAQFELRPSDAGSSEDSPVKEAQDQAHWLEPEPMLRHAGNAATASSPSRACVRSLTRTWTAVTIPTVLVDMEADDVDSTSPVDTSARALQRLQQQARLAPSVPGSLDPDTAGSTSDPATAIATAAITAAAMASPAGVSSAISSPVGSAATPASAASPRASAAASGWLARDGTSPPAPQQLGSSSNNGSGAHQRLLPALSGRGDGNGAAAVGSLASPRFGTGAGGGSGGGDCGGVRDAVDDADERNDGDADNREAAGAQPQALDFLIRPPGLASALSCLRPQQPSTREPRLQRRYYKSLEHLSDVSLTRFTADNVVSGGAAVGFASTGGNPAAADAGRGDMDADGGGEFTGEWLVFLGRSVQSSPHVPGAALKPTPRTPSLPTAAAATTTLSAPVVPRSKWPASPRTNMTSQGLTLSPPHHHQQQQQQQSNGGQQRQPEAGSAIAAAMRSASPPPDKTRQIRKRMTSSFSSVAMSTSDAGPAAVTPPPPPPHQHQHQQHEQQLQHHYQQQQQQQLPSPLQLSCSAAPTTGSAGVSTLMSYLLINADRPPWKLSRAESALQQRAADTSVDIARSMSRKPSVHGRSPPLKLASFGRNAVGGAGGSGGSGGTAALSPQGQQGRERSWQSFTGGLESPASSSYGDLTDAAVQDRAVGAAGGNGAGHRRHTMTAATSPTGQQARHGSSLLPSQAASPTGAQQQSHVRFRQQQQQQQQHLKQPQHQHNQHSLQSSSSVAAAQDHHLFRPQCSDDLPGSPASRSASISVSAAAVPDAALAKRAQNQKPYLDDSCLAALLVNGNGGGGGGVATAAKPPQQYGGAAVASLAQHHHQQSAQPSPPLGQQQQQQQQQQLHSSHQPQQHLVPNLSTNQHRRRPSLLRKLSDGEPALLAAAGSGGGSGSDAAALLLAAEAVAAPRGGGAAAGGAASGGSGGREQHYRVGGGGGAASARLEGGGGARGGVDGGCSELDGADGLMARLFRTLNDLRRLESAARVSEDG